MEITTISVKIVSFEFPHNAGYDSPAEGATEFGLEAKVEPGEDLKVAYRMAYQTLLETIYAPVTTSSSSNMETRRWKNQWNEERKQQQNEAVALQRKQEEEERKRQEERTYRS